MPERVAMEPSMVCNCVSLLAAQLPTHCWHSVTGKDNRLVDTAKQFYPNLLVHGFWAAVSQEIVRNGVQSFGWSKRFIMYGTAMKEKQRNMRQSMATITQLQSFVQISVASWPHRRRHAQVRWLKLIIDARAPQARGGDRSNHPLVCLEGVCTWG